MICQLTDFEEQITFLADKKVIYEISIMILGLILIAWTIPDFVYKLSNQIILVDNYKHMTKYDTEFLISSAIKIFFGIIAIIYARTFSKFLAKEKNVIVG